MDDEDIARFIVDSSMKVHTALGPGLLEIVYEACLAHELAKRSLSVRRQVALPIVYDDLRIENAFRIDLLVNDRVVVELKAAESLLPVHSAQLLSYLKLAGCKLGLLLNFNVVHMKDGIKRMVNGF